MIKVIISRVTPIEYVTSGRLESYNSKIDELREAGFRVQFEVVNHLINTYVMFADEVDAIAFKLGYL